MAHFKGSYRVSVFVPEEAFEAFLQAISPAIPSFLGHYDHVCWWSEKGIEQFRKIDGDGHIVRAACRRVSFSMPVDDDLLDMLIQKHILPVHPWEEPVILVAREDIFLNT
ncbi:MAG: hypothetical protein KDI13_07140 [Alphaproteobacteria bacterium]|nr:hypothetical protein [Alphaproteobacteria bacterium]